MQEKNITLGITNWIFGILIFTIGVMNLFLVHPVPGIVYLLLSLIYFPPVNEAFRKRTGIRVPAVVKIVLGIIIIWFTLGISDLAEMYGL